MMHTRICHLTSVHPRHDTRIFIKEIPSLMKAGFSVCAVVADGKGNDSSKGFQIFDIGVPKNRLHRIFWNSQKVFKKALEINAEIYHFHDPELISVGVKLIKVGKKVIYDIHEDVPRDILTKYWIPTIILKRLIAYFYEMYENKSAKKFSYLFTATPFIKERFLKINKRCIDINNYPLLDELDSSSNIHRRGNKVCYIGGISEVRGIENIIDAIDKADIKLILAGEFESQPLRDNLIRKKGWINVDERGFVNRKEAALIMANSIAGFVLFHPVPNHFDALPNKIFEYMSARLPVIASNFPQWKEIIEESDCGICVNPLDSSAISKAIEFLKKNPEVAEKMGKNGRDAVLKKYNWGSEEKKLIDYYRKLL